MFFLLLHCTYFYPALDGLHLTCGNVPRHFQSFSTCLLPRDDTLLGRISVGIQQSQMRLPLLASTMHPCKSLHLVIHHPQGVEKYKVVCRRHVQPVLTHTVVVKSISPLYLSTSLRSPSLQKLSMILVPGSTAMLA